MQTKQKRTFPKKAGVDCWSLEVEGMLGHLPVRFGLRSSAFSLVNCSAEFHFGSVFFPKLDYSHLSLPNANLTSLSLLLQIYLFLIGGKSPNCALKICVVEK